jgi:hypothetical protein
MFGLIRPSRGMLIMSRKAEWCGTMLPSVPEQSTVCAVWPYKSRNILAVHLQRLEVPSNVFIALTAPQSVVSQTVNHDPSRWFVEFSEII